MNALFDAHVEAHGHPADPNNKTNNHRHLVGDSSGYALVQSLESPSKDVDARGKVTYTYEKAPIMQRRILRPVVEPETAADLSDAYKISMTYRGRVEVDFIASLLNLSPDEARAQLLDTGLVFEDPMTGLIVDSDEYLSGNVVAKYIAAEAAAKEDSRYQRNAAALADVRPELKQPAQIAFQIGQTWIPNEIYSLFAQAALGIPYADVRIDPLNRSFTGSGGSRDWGTSRVDAADLLRAVVLDKAIAVYDGSGENRVFNPEATEAALSKAEEIRREFGNWVKSAPLEIGGLVVGEIAAEEYNRVVNVLRPPMFRGEWVNLPDQSGEINLTDHRKAVIARFLTQGYGMMAHGVGSGKTYAQIALAHELKRLGKANKVVIVAMNPTVEQFAASYKKAYPQARLLVANPKGNFDKSRRAQFYSQMATGDFDAIIIPHSTLKQIPHSPAAIAAHYEMLLQELNAGLAAAIAAGNKKGANQIRTKIRKTRESMAKRMAKAAENRDDGAIEWESMGIDALIVDEAHAFKNAPVVTALKRVKNLPTGSASDNALSMMLKTADVQRRRRGKNVFFATGTPITNTIAEAFVMLRYLAPEAMRDLQIHSFDDFVRNFATTEENPEATWRGKVQMTTRLSKFVNGQGLINLIRSVFDVALGNEKLGLDVPRVKGGGPNQIVVEQTDPGQVINDWILDIVDSYEGIQWGTYSEQERKTLGAIPIVTMQAGLAAATDPRLIDPAAPDDPNSKVNRMVDEIWKIYQEGKAEKVTQAVFSDLRRPFKTKLLVDTGMISGLPFGSEAMGVDQSEEEEEAQDEDEDDDSDNRFDLFENIRAKLVAKGMNPKEIWWPTSESAEKLADQFDKLNSGEIRLVLGGTAKIGTGVNFQERLGAVHHLNPPRDMKPAMMEQRNGRIIRQGNLHAEWAHNAFVEVVEKAAGQKFEGKNPRKRRDAAQAWLEENGRPDVAEAAETAAARYDIQIFEYASENSIDSAIFSMMAAKQGFIAQALSETTSEDEFADPADEIKMAMAEIAARTMGDPDLIRMVELEREVRELRNRAQNYAGTIANKRGDIRSLRHNLRWIQENDAARAALPPSIETLFDDPKALPVWKFGNFTFDPYDKKKDATPMVGGIERWLSDLRPGNHSLTVGDLKIGVQKYDSLRRDEPASGELEIRVGGIALAKRGFKGAKGLIQQTYGLVRDVAAGDRTDRANQRRIERELPILEGEDLDAPFPEEDKLRETEDAYAAVRQRVVALLEAKAEERAARRAERLGRNVQKDPGEDAIVAMVSNAAGVINAPEVARIWAEQQERARPVETLPGLAPLAMGAPTRPRLDLDADWSTWPFAEVVMDIAGVPERVRRPMRKKPKLSVLQRHAGGPRALERALDNAGLAMGAWHGTPHKVDRFSVEKIGTGEGNQAYGWGLYFAEAKAVAEQYRDTLSNIRRYSGTIDGRPPRDRHEAEMAWEIENEYGGDVEAYLAAIRDRNQQFLDAQNRYWGDRRPPEKAAAQERELRLDYLDKEHMARNLAGKKIDIAIGGRLYRVDIKADPETEFLDYNKPLAQQHPKIREAYLRALREVLKVNPTRLPAGFDPDRIAGGGYAAALGTIDDRDPDKSASMRMLAQGIKGIRYLGSGGRNFVVFDDSLVEILEENGKAVSAPVRAEQLALAMGYRPADGPGRESDPQAWDDETAIRSTLDYFSRKLPSPAAMDERRRRVGEATSKAEPAGDLNLDGTPNRVDIRREIAAVRDAQLDNLRGQTHEQWMAEAKRLIARDYEGVVRELLEAAQEGRPLDNPAMVKAAQIIIPRVWREAKATGDRQGIRDAQALTYAYLEGGTRASYVLGARRDMFRTPAERHVDFLAGIIGRVPPEVRKRAEAAPTPAEKRRKIAELQDQLTRARETARGKSAEVEELEARIEKAKGAGAAGLAEIARLNQELANVKSVHNATAQRARETIDRLEAEQAANKAQIAKLEKQLVNVKRLHNASVDNAKGSIKRLGAALGEARKQKDRAEILGEAHEARLAKVEATLAEMGLSLHDIFSHQAVVRLRGSEIVARVIEENFSAPQRAAIRFSLPPEGHSPRDVAKRTGVARETIPGLMTKFRQKIEARFLELAKKGLTLSDFMTEEGGMFNVTDRIGEQGESLRFGTAPVTEEQAKAAAAEMMNALFGGHHTLEDRRGRRKPNQAPFDINNPVHVAQVGQTLKTAVDAGAFDMAYEYWINGILSGPQTHAVNIAGNAMNIAMEYGAQRWMEAIWNTLIGDPKGATFGEYGHIIRSIPGTWAKSFAAAVKAWNTEESFLSAELLNDPTKVGGAEKAGGLNNESRKAIPDRLGKLGTTGGKDLVTAVAGFVKGKGWSGVSVGRTVRIPGRALLFMDTLFKSVVARTEVAGQAYRRGRAQGIQGAALESFMKGEVNTPGSESWIAAVDKAEELTFTNDLKGAADGGGFFEQIVKKLQDSRHADTTLSPLAASAIGWFFPFIQTPFQIFKTGLRRTPFGAFGVLSHLLKTGVVTWRQGGPFLENYGKARLARDLTDQTIGLLITWILYGMVEGDDDDDTKNWLITGSRPYGVVNQGERELTDRLEGGAMTLRIGGRDGMRFDFSRLEPFATILGSITDSVRSIKRMENGAAKVDELAKFHQYALSQATDKTFLQGIVKIGELMEPGQTTGATAARTVLQAIVPNWVRQPLRLTDDYVRESKTAPWYYHAVPLGKFAEPKPDLYGNPMRKGATPFAPVLGPLDRVARIGIDTGLEPGRVPHVADIAIRNWNRENPEKGDQYFPPGNTIRTFKDFAGRTQRLSAAQLAEVERIGGVRLRVMLAQSISLAEAQNPTEATIEKIRAARSKVFAAARDEVVARPSPTPRRGRPLAEGRAQ